MSILSNQTPKDLEKNPIHDRTAKRTGTVFDSCFFTGKYEKEMDCEACPHNKRCSWYAEKKLIQ